MASGVKITDEVKKVFEKVTMTTSRQSKLKCAIFKFSPDYSQIVVDSTRDQSAEDDIDYDTFIKDLPPGEVRYCVFDMPYINKDGTEKSDIVFVSWHPDTCPVKQKMLCASSLNALRSALQLKTVLEGDCLAEVDYAAALEKVGGKPAIKK